MKGDVAAALANLKDQYDVGADPGQVLIDLASFVHFVTKTKVAPDRFRSFRDADRARARRRLRADPVDVRAVARLADPAQGRRGSEGFAAPAARRRHGAGAPRLCRRSAGARGCSQGARSRAVGRGFASVFARSSRGAPSPSGGPGGASNAAPRLAASQAAPSVAPVLVSAVPAPDGAPLVLMRSFAELVALAAEKRDIQTQGRAGARRASGAVRAGRAGVFARPRRFGGACRAIDAEIAGLDRPALDGGAVVGARRADT